MRRPLVGIELERLGWEVVDWIHLAQDKDRRQAPQLLKKDSAPCSCLFS
jgi:hypothetical protein